MSVLLELASRRGETVSRTDIVSAVWPRGYVTDDVLTRCISQLRTALGDDPKAPSYIATVPRRGYRLVADVSVTSKRASDGILVLPFQNLAAHGKDEYLADGLTELLIARLAVALDQRVISRTSAMAYRGISTDIRQIREDLGVKWVVEGSLLQLGKQLQIVVQLIDADTDAHAWAETWARPAEDIMAVLNEATRNISTQITAQLTDVAAVSPEIHSLPDELMRRYLQGMHHASRRAEASLRQAAICFKDVLKARPDHAPALAGLAFCHMLLVHYGAEPAEQGIPRVRDLCRQALEVDPQNADAIGHLAAVSFFHDWDFEQAAERARAALAAKPNAEMMMILAANVNLISGRYEQSQTLVDRAVASDPLNVGLLMNAGDLLILQQRYGEAIRCLSQALEIEPSMRPACLRLALAHALEGAAQDAAEMLSRAAEMGGKDAAYFEYQALVAGQAGEARAAREAATALEEMSSDGSKAAPWSLARAWAAAGDTDRALLHLEEAYRARSTSMPFLGQTPALRLLRDRPEVRRLMGRIGIPA